MWMRYGIVLVTIFKKGSFSNCHILLLFARATKRNVKIQLHVCNLHYTKESLGLYRSTFPSNMIIAYQYEFYRKKTTFQVLLECTLFSGRKKRVIFFVVDLHKNNINQSRLV